MDSPAAMLVLILVIVVAFIVLAALLGSFFTINTAERGVVERFNKFSRIAGPGPSLKVPFAESVHRVDMRRPSPSASWLAKAWGKNRDRCQPVGCRPAARSMLASMSPPIRNASPLTYSQTSKMTAAPREPKRSV